MTRTIAAFALCLLASALVLPAAAQVISVTPTTIDLGVMQQMEEKTTEVTVTNNGAARLVIGEVRTDCGCTVPTLAKKELGPGESTVIEINFNSKKFHGKIVKMVHIISNDPRNQTVDVMLNVNVKTRLLVDPASQRVGFTRGVATEDRTKVVTFTAMEDDQLEIKCDQTRKRQFNVKVTNGVDGNPRVSTLELTLPQGAEPGRKRDSAQVHTNIEGYEKLSIDVRGWVVSSLGYQPAELKFRYKKEFNASIRFSPEVPDLKFKITGAECDLPEIQLVIDETKPNLETLLEVKGTPISNDDPRAIAKRGRVNGTITVFTDLDEQPEVKIPVSYMVRM